MKLDMHCHVKEGSVDSKVSLDEYITKLKANGFDGMLITDHDTYKGIPTLEISNEGTSS